MRRRLDRALATGFIVAASLVASSAAAQRLRQHDAFVLLRKPRMARIELSHHFNGNITDEQTELAINELRAGVQVPTVRWGSGGLAVGVKYSLSAFDVGEVTGQLVDDGAHLLHQAGLMIGLMQVLDDRWYLTIGLHPYLSSDFKEFDADTLFIEGRAEVGWACSKTLAFRFGVAAHARFGMYLPFPILGLAYRGSWYRLDVLLPRIVKGTFSVGKRLSFDAFSELFPQVWDINEDGLGTRFKYMRVKVGAGVEVCLWKGLALRLAGGVMPLRIISSYAVEDAGDKEYDLRGDLVPFLDLGLSFGRNAR